MTGQEYNVYKRSELNQYIANLIDLAENALNRDLRSDAVRELPKATAELARLINKAKINNWN